LSHHAVNAKLLFRSNDLKVFVGIKNLFFTKCLNGESVINNTSLILPGLGLVISVPLATGIAGAGDGGVTAGIVGALIAFWIPNVDLNKESSYQNIPSKIRIKFVMRQNRRKLCLSVIHTLHIFQNNPYIFHFKKHP
jgi:hypothetical protein